jgi:polysaccharide deacetylase family protein (PEP-CTERM system associated)
VISRKATADGSPIHAMTCDVEDYFQVSAFSDHVSRDQWQTYECRIPRNVDLILKMFAETGTTATFFTLGWVAQHYPNVIRAIVSEGHEIASHGMQHTRVWQQSRAEFMEDAGSSKKILEDISGTSVIGYRAASWSIDTRTPWAHDVLAESGYKYSSSIYPIKHDHFGMPNAPVEPYWVGDGKLLEVPASVANILGRNVPASGGGYFRLYPLRFSKWLIEKIEASEQRPYVFYFHPWEVDAEQPRIDAAPLKSRFRHYLNLHKFDARLKNLLDHYNWSRMDEIYLGESA